MRSFVSTKIYILCRFSYQAALKWVLLNTHQAKRWLEILTTQKRNLNISIEISRASLFFYRADKLQFTKLIMFFMPQNQSIYSMPTAILIHLLHTIQLIYYTQNTIAVISFSGGRENSMYVLKKKKKTLSIKRCTKVLINSKKEPQIFYGVVRIWGVAAELNSEIWFNEIQTNINLEASQAFIKIDRRKITCQEIWSKRMPNYM